MSLDNKIPPKVRKCKSGTIKEAIRNAPPPRSLERYGDGDLVFSFGETKKVIKMETSPQVARNNYFSFKQKIMSKINEQRKERWNAYEARKLIYDQEILEEEDLIDLEEDLALTDSEEEDGDDKKEENGEKKPKEKKTSDKNGDIELPDDKESQDVEEVEDDEDEDDEDEDKNEEESGNDIDMEDQSSNQSAQKEETIVSRKHKPTQENVIETNEQSVASSLDDEETDMIFNRKRKPRVIDDEDESNDSISVLSESDANSNMKSKSKKNQKKKSTNLDLDDEVSMDDIISAIGGEKTKNQKRTENDLSDIEEDYDAENEEDEDEEEEEEEEADDEVDSDDEVKEIEKEERRSRNVFVSDEARDAYDDEEEDEEPNEEDAAMINDEDEDEEEDEEGEDEDDKENKNGEEDEEEEKEVRPIDFFFNEAEVSGTDSSDDEDGEDEIVRELIDEEADKLDAEKIRKDVAQTYHKELANEDKRMLLQLQERYLEDGDLHSDHKRAKKFRWGTASSTWLDNARNSDSSSNEEDDDDDDDDENVPVFRLRNTSLPLSSTENKMPDLSFNSGSTLSKLPSSTLSKPSSSITSYLVRDKQLNNILSTKRSDPFDKYRGMGIKKLKPGSSETKSLFDLYK